MALREATGSPDGDTHTAVNRGQPFVIRIRATAKSFDGSMSRSESKLATKKASAATSLGVCRAILPRIWTKTAPPAACSRTRTPANRRSARYRRAHANRPLPRIDRLDH